MPENKPKVAIVCDWLIGGGAEAVVLELHRLFPEAPIYTSYCSPEWREKLDNKVVTGPLQAWPFSRLRKFIPFLRIWWFSSLKFKGYDLVISSSGAEAKGIKVPPGTPHLAYIHAPTHYYWSRYDQYIKHPGFGWLDGLARLGLTLLVKPLRKGDYRAAQRPDHLIANSTHTQAQIKKYYGRDSEVIHPPVDTEFFDQSSKTRTGFVIVGRQTPYKRIDLAVAACTELGVELTVIGSGPEHNKLCANAGPSITFVENAGREQLAHILSSSQAFIFPGLEDFGIAPVEALAAGTPVIAYHGGGALDFITPETGMFFDEQTVESLAKALKSFDPAKYSHRGIKQAAEQFSRANFQKSLSKTVQKALE